MLRPAEITDATAILETRIAAIRELASPHYPQAEIDEWCTSRTAETYHAPIERKAVLVYEVSGKVVAFGQLNTGAALVEAVYVSPAYSRRGLACKSCARWRLWRLSTESLHSHLRLRSTSLSFIAGPGMFQYRRARMQSAKGSWQQVLSCAMKYWRPLRPDPLMSNLMRPALHFPH